VTVIVTPHCTQKNNAEKNFFCATTQRGVANSVVCVSANSEDDTAHPRQLLSFVGTAQAPSGYKILESCPSLKTDKNIQNLIDTKILYAWDDKDRQGWFEGRVHGRNLNARDLARAPTANFSVRYSQSLTVGVKKKKIIPLCHVAHELTSRTYGEKKWWVVIVKNQ